MKSSLLIVLLIISYSIPLRSQEIGAVNRKDHRDVAKFFCENYHRGNFGEAKSVAGSSFKNFIQNFCERGMCEAEIDEDFTFQEITGQVNYRSAYSKISYSWSGNRFLEVTLYQDENYDWFVYGCTRSEQAKDVADLRPRKEIRDNQFFESRVDRSSYIGVAKYYCENYYSGNFEEVIEVVRPLLRTEIERRCIQRNGCEEHVVESFEFKVISEGVDFHSGYAQLKILWGSSKYLQMALYRYENGDWIVLGCTPGRQARELSTMLPGLKIPGAVPKN